MAAKNQHAHTQLTIDVEDRSLVDAVRDAAAARGQSLEAAVVEALVAWLEAQEDADDLAAVRDAKASPEERVSWEDMRRRYPALADRGE